MFCSLSLSLSLSLFLSIFLPHSPFPLLILFFHCLLTLCKYCHFPLFLFPYLLFLAMSLTFLSHIHMYIQTLASIHVGKLLFQHWPRLHRLCIGKQKPFQVKETQLLLPFEGFPAVQWHVVALCISIAYSGNSENSELHYQPEHFQP